jgi:hypothetical protein
VTIITRLYNDYCYYVIQWLTNYYYVIITRLYNDQLTIITMLLFLGYIMSITAVLYSD